MDVSKQENAYGQDIDANLPSYLIFLRLHTTFNDLLYFSFDEAHYIFAESFVQVLFFHSQWDV